MARNFKKFWVVLPALLVLGITCTGGDEPTPTPVPTPTATPEPTSTPVPVADQGASPINTGGVTATFLTEAELQCLAVEMEIMTQLLADDLSAADVLSVIPALQTCAVDLARLIEAADDLLAENAGEGFPGLDSLPFSAEQIACLLLFIDAELLEDLIAGNAGQSEIAPALEVFSACGIGLADLLALR